MVDTYLFIGNLSVIVRENELIGRTRPAEILNARKPRPLLGRREAKLFGPIALSHPGIRIR